MKMDKQSAFGIGKCSRCSKVAQLNWHICKECSNTAQEKYRKECKSFVNNLIVGRDAQE